MTRPSPELFSLTEATSNAGAGVWGDCARTRDSIATPDKAIAARAAAEVAADTHRVLKVKRFMVSSFLPILVRYEPLHSIDDQHVDRFAPRVEPEPELLLQGRENRRRGRPIDRVRHAGGRRRWSQLRRHVEFDVEVAAEPGAIDHRPAHRRREEHGKRVERDPAEAHRASGSWAGRAAWPLRATRRRTSADPLWRLRAIRTRGPQVRTEFSV